MQAKFDAPSAWYGLGGNLLQSHPALQALALVIAFAACVVLAGWRAGR
jgi:hypothetical protein